MITQGIRVCLIFCSFNSKTYQLHEVRLWSDIQIDKVKPRLVYQMLMGDTGT